MKSRDLLRLGLPLLLLACVSRAEDKMPVWDLARRTYESAMSQYNNRQYNQAAAARRLERMVSWRCRLFALPYGDQGLLISRVFYESLGGFEPLPIMEDVDLIRRIGRARLSVLDCPAITSAKRFREGGYLGRSARNLTCLALYFLGAPPRFLTKLYG